MLFSTKKLMDELISSVKSDLFKAFEKALSRDKLSALENQIADFGITIFGIIDLSGQPLLIKSYTPSNDSNDNDKANLFGGFIAALSNFAKAEFSGKIQDFAINNQRIFFKFVGRVIFIVSIREDHIGQLTINNFNVFSEKIFESTVNNFLPEYTILSQEIDGLNSWLDDFELSLDEFLFESIQDLEFSF